MEAHLFDELFAELGWMRDAVCVETTGVEFFPERGKPTAPAKAVCAGCLVRNDCLVFAMMHDIRWGVWGGLSSLERRELRRQPR